jgi:hypothetical protein
MRLLFESPAELAGLLSRSANGFRGGAAGPLPGPRRGAADVGGDVDSGVEVTRIFETVTPVDNTRGRCCGRRTGSGSSLEGFEGTPRTTRTVVGDPGWDCRGCRSGSSFT